MFAPGHAVDRLRRAFGSRPDRHTA